MKKILQTAFLFAALAASAVEPKPPEISSFMFRDAPIEYAMSMLGETWGRHIVVNDSAKSVRIRTFLRDIDCLAALKAICHGHGLWYREDPECGIVYVQTVEEFTKGGALSEKKFVEVVSLAYPRCEDIAAAIQEAYRDMVVYTAPDQDDDDEIGDISRAFDRMDQLGDRSAVISGDADQTSRTSSNRGRTTRRRNLESSRGMENIRRYADDVKRLDKHVEYEPETSQGAEAGDAPKLISPSIVFLSIVRRSNSVILRSADREILSQIKETIAELDRPKPQVLLEVRVLQLDVTDAKDREIDFLANSENQRTAGGFMNSGGVGYVDGAWEDSTAPTVHNIGRLRPMDAATPYTGGIFQMLDKRYNLRIKMLDSKGKVRSLATPSLMVADCEASRIFVGEEYSLLMDVENTATTTSGDDPVTTVTSNPVTERRDVGFSLILSPKIHADGTVTLRVMQENASRGTTSETIAYGQNDTFETWPILKRLITSTVVAKSGETLALGGLIRHETSDTVSRIPYLADIPFLGKLFEHKNKEERDEELIVLIRPYVILTPTSAEQMSRKFALANLEDSAFLREALDLGREEKSRKAFLKAFGDDVEIMETPLGGVNE